MRRYALVLCGLAVLLLACPSAAAKKDKPKAEGKAKAKRGGEGGLRGYYAVMAGVFEFNDDQKAKLTEAIAARDAALAEWDEGEDGKKLAELMKKAKEADKDAAKGLRKEAGSLRKERAELEAAQKVKIMEILTEEQKVKWEGHLLYTQFMRWFNRVGLDEAQTAKLLALCAKAGKGKTVALLRYARDMERGEKLTRKDIEMFRMFRVPKESVHSLGYIVVEEINKDYVVGSKINQDVQKGLWVLWAHVITDSLRPKKGWVAVSIEVDPRTVLPGDMVWVGSRVNIVAMLPVRGQSPSAKRVIEAVRVLAVVGRTHTYDSGSTQKRVSTSYRAITIEVKKGVSLKLQNVLSHKSGNIRLELRNPDASLPPGAGEISPELESLTRSSYKKPPSRP